MSDENPHHAICMAVLPFENLSDDPDHAYFASGFVEDLTTDLAHFPNLNMIASYSSRKIGGASRDIIDAARKLDIDYLLKGTLRRKGADLRITTRLLETRTGRILWTERFDAPLDAVFDIQDNIVERVSGAISTQIDMELLAAARNKPLTSLAAYDCWLRGMEQLRRGTPEADRQARKTFEQALAIDPHYSRAYAGLSLSHFNEWSCQLWEQWEETERKAYDYAMQAAQLDGTDYITQLILGRILLYRRQFDEAEAHINQSLALNANDADNLIHIATCKGFLGKGAEGERLYLKALRLNPFRSMWYYTGGAFTYFVQGKYPACIETGRKGPLTDVWIDLPAYIAAAHAHLDQTDQAAYYLDLFKKIFHEKIITAHIPDAEEIIRWEKLANPFKHDNDMAALIDGLKAAGLGASVQSNGDGHQTKPPPHTQNHPAVFRKGPATWLIAYAGTRVELPEVKGFHDIARLLAAPEAEIHCTELAGIVDSLVVADPVADKQAIKAYRQKVRDLKEEIASAEAMNDLPRRQKFSEELQQLTDHLSRLYGVGQRKRSLNAPSERARAAVTWRIRNAIKKVEKAHPALGRHLANAIHTGAFCSYTPETDHVWDV